MARLPEAAKFAMLGLAAAVAAFAVSCAGGKPKPVEIVLSEDACAHCRMAVTERKFAAEAVSPDGVASYFDDIGCLARWYSDGRAKPGSAIYVVDFQTGEWLDAEAATYLVSSKIPTPMSFGIIAFGSQQAASASEYAANAQITGWDGILADAANPAASAPEVKQDE
ncbi:MAG: nitrous oxide reductase accessory protein NosL [bacterium]|jgi:copper chaperone NosL